MRHELLEAQLDERGFDHQAELYRLRGQLPRGAFADLALEAERYTIETALKMGVAPRVELLEPQGFEPYLEMGVKHFNVGIDIKTLFDWFCKSGSTMRRELGIEPLAATESPRAAYGE